MLDDELAQQAVDVLRRGGIELARRLVGDEKARAMCECGAERDALLLASGELARAGRRPVEEADSLEELAGPSPPFALVDRREPERDGDELLRGELARECLPVVLVGVAENVSAVSRELPRRGTAELEPGDEHRPGRRPLEPGQHAHERRLARTARAQHDADLALVHRQREPAQRGDAAGRGRIHGVEVSRIDDRRHR